MILKLKIINKHLVEDQSATIQMNKFGSRWTILFRNFGSSVEVRNIYIKYSHVELLVMKKKHIIIV